MTPVHKNAFIGRRTFPSVARQRCIAVTAVVFLCLNMMLSAEILAGDNVQQTLLAVSPNNSDNTTPADMNHTVEKTQTFALSSARDLKNPSNLRPKEVEKFMTSSCRTLNVHEFYKKGACANPVKKNLFFHDVGKAGTGTIRLILGGFGKLDGYCHPFPCPEKVPNMTSNPDTSPLHFINIRDPVTRFQSAFDWACTLECGPNSTLESRVESSGKERGDPLHYCRISSAEVRHVLHTLYQNNANLLAKGFCALEQNKTLKLQDSKAWKDAQEVGHQGHQLVDWLQAYFSKNQTSAIYDSAKPELAMVMMEKLPHDAKDLPFESRARRFAHYGKLRFLFANNASQYLPSVQQSKEEDAKFAKYKGLSHSSKQLKQFPPLTERNQCCLSRYFLAADYALLRAILQGHSKAKAYPLPELPFLDAHEQNEGFTAIDKQLSQACSWGSADVDEHLCLASLQSMLLRRQHYFGHQTCGEIYGKS